MDKTAGKTEADKTADKTAGKTEASKTAGKAETGKTEASKPAGKTEGTYDQAYVLNLRAEADKFKAEAKANAEKASEYDKQVEANKSELEKAQEAAATAQKSAATERLSRLRAEVGQAKGLSPAMTARLSGDTLEALQGDADSMVKDLSATHVARGGSSRSTTGAGKAGGDQSYEDMSPADLVKLSSGR